MASPAVANEHSEIRTEQPQDGPVALSPVVEVAPPYELPPAAAETPETQAVVQTAERSYPSLYDTQQGTLLAIGLAGIIIAGVLWSVARIYQRSRDEHAALTQFVTTMVALVVGAYIADLLVAGPDTSLLTEGEHASILAFIKDTCLMVFSYYFGTRAVPPPQASIPSEQPAPSNPPSEGSDV
jgi:hypothetical protein